MKDFIKVTTKRFIEVTTKNRTYLLNVKHIEDVWKDKDGKCTIFFEFNIPGAVEHDYIIPRESYDEVMRMIKEAMG